MAYSQANICSVFKINVGLASPGDHTSALTFMFLQELPTGRETGRSCKTMSGTVGTVLRVRIEIIGPEMVKEGFLEGDVLDSIVRVLLTFLLPPLSSFLLHNDQPSWSRQ